MANKDNAGALFKNKKKLTDAHPDYTGSVTVEGKDYMLSAWVNTGQQSGEKYFALKLTPKAATIPIPEPTPAQVLASAQPTTVPDPVDDLPF